MAVFLTHKDNEVPFVPTSSIYLKFVKEAFPDDCTELLEKYQLAIKGPHRSENEMIVGVSSKISYDPVELAAELQKNKLIDIAEPDFVTPIDKKVYVDPKNQLLSQQWHLENLGGKIGLKKDADARVVNAWKAMDKLGITNNRGSSDITIAIIDDGFDLDHPNLGGKIVNPRDFSRNNERPIPDLIAQDWHGTACAGVALGNEGQGEIIGAAPNARFMPIRWGPYLSNEEIEKWFKYATEKGADIVSCSWGAEARNFPLSTLAWNAISDCATKGRNGKGCVVVFAAGNEARDINDQASGSVNGFAIHPEVIAVAASTSTDKVASYSNFGKEISICAPSSGLVGILTSDVLGLPGYDKGDYTYDFGGTSSATALVSGICGLILSVNPELSHKEVKNILQSTARKIGIASSYDTNGHSLQFGYGCVDAEKAVIEAASFRLKKRESTIIGREIEIEEDTKRKKASKYGSVEVEKRKSSGSGIEKYSKRSKS